MLYDRKIKYVDYYENGERVKGGGFVKLEVRDGIMKMDLNIRGLHSTDSFVRDVVVNGPETEEVLGQITLQEGAGSFYYSCRVSEGIGSSGIPYEELKEIKIPVGGSRELCCIWRELSSKAVAPAEPSKAEKQEREVQEPEVQEPEVREREVQEREIKETEVQRREVQGTEVHEPESLEAISVITGGEETETQDADLPKPDIRKTNPSKTELQEAEFRGTELPKTEQPKTEHPETTLPEIAPPETELQETELRQAELQRMKHQETEPQETERPQTKLQKSEPRKAEVAEKKLREADSISSEPERSESVRQGQSRQEEKPAVKLLENKWQQLSAIYPHIRPFQDDRDYLSLSPSDFVMFPESYYRAANNSFLLHGFYNYKHLILARVERRGEVRYYLGVPGNYYEREKQVAVMFGFESFECDREPAKTGDFGYYMMRMEL